MIQFNSRWIKSSPIIAVFSSNILFRSITSRKMAFANGSVDLRHPLVWQFYFNFKVFGDFQCVKHLLCQCFLAAIKHSYSIQMRTLSPCIFPFWKCRHNTFLVDLNSIIAILSLRLTSYNGEYLFVCKQMPATTVNHMTETAHQIICFLLCRDPPYNSAPGLLFV